MLAKGQLIHAPNVGISITLNDGAAHAVDSSDIAFQEAARGAFRETYPKAGPQILEHLRRFIVIQRVACDPLRVLDHLGGHRGGQVGFLNLGSEGTVERD